MIRRMLADDAIDRATEADVTRFEEALIARFDTPTAINEIETANLETAILALENLKQGKDEDLRSYYNRTKGFLEEAGGRDFRETMPPQTFSIIERSFLNGVITKFIRGLANETVMTRMFGYNAQPNRSLGGAYSKAELNLVQLKAEEEQYKQVQEQNHARLLQNIGNALLEGKQPHQMKGMLAQLEIFQGSMKLSSSQLNQISALELAASRTYDTFSTVNRPRERRTVGPHQPYLSDMGRWKEGEW